MVTTVKAMGTATAPETSEFERAWHSAFALLALAHAPLLGACSEFFATAPADLWWRRWWGGDTGVLTNLLTDLVPLTYVVILAWLAFVALDTRSGVRLIPHQLRDIGLIALVLFVGVELVQAGSLLGLEVEALELHAGAWGTGSRPMSALILTLFLGALAEELVYRALLLRALEGWLARWPALVVQALVFELVHVFVYGLPFQGGYWFVLGFVYGYALQTSRSVAVPTLMHMVHNLLFFVIVGLRVG